MAQKEKCRPSQMSIRILMTILQNPGRYTRTELAEQVGISRYRINGYLDAYTSEGLEVNINEVDGKLTVLMAHSHKELKNLLAMNDDDKRLIDTAISYLSSSKQSYIKRKIATLYDFQKLGLRSLRKPHLDKMDKLEISKKYKKQAILVNYRSNSNEIKNRLIECIIVEPNIGTVQVYDIDRQDVRHFKLDRIDRVDITDVPWQHEALHHKKETDDFRIANDQQTHVHLSLSVKAYNLMLDTYPQTKEHLIPGDKGQYDYAAKVNADFLGLAPFILANTDQITILEPPALREHIIDMANKARTNVRKTHIE